MSFDFEELAAQIRQHEVGRGTRIHTPFGERLIGYADLTATGRYLGFVDAWIDRARPYYANTHTEVSSTGSLFTQLREQARQTVAESVGANADDRVVFVGSGSTAAVNQLVGMLGLKIPEPLERAHHLLSGVPAEERPVVFVGPYEHHSNLLPWLESIADVAEIGLDEDRRIDLRDLRQRLERFQGRPMKIGTFSAASNVTGILSDVRALARVLHDAGALAFFDYAAAGPYLPIDMHPDDPAERLDAIFLSPHKFVGGPEASGILVAHHSLFRGATPARPGGGTVEWVAGIRHEDVDYVTDLAAREEGGTPAIVGDLRAAAAFLVKEMLGPERILEHETRLAADAMARLERHPAIRILGPRHVPRLAILSLVIDGLHHDFVSALLDHLFGIQNRAGCSCAGPYGHQLLGIAPERSNRYRSLVHRGFAGMKPGWVRLSLPYYASPADIDFMLSAVEFVAEHGADFLPLYRFSWRDGVWRHVDGTVPVVPGLELSREALGELLRHPGARARDVAPDDAALAAERQGYFDEARGIASGLAERNRTQPPGRNPPSGDPEIDGMVWFRYVHADEL